MQNTSYLKLLLNDSFVYEFETCNGFSESRALEVFYACLKKIVLINAHTNYTYKISVLVLQVIQQIKAIMRIFKAIMISFTLHSK